MKYFAFILAGTVIAIVGGISFVHAQDYTPLAPLPGTYTGSVDDPSTTLPTYLAGMMKLLIAVSGGLAVLMMIIGGTQYVAAGITPDAKSSAKERIQNAAIGLALTLASYLILLSINPQLVEFDLSLPPIQPKTEDIILDTSEIQPGEAGSWPDDNNVRLSLLTGGYNIGVNRNNCKAIGQQLCTSLAGMSSTVVNRLKQLNADCGLNLCKIQISGGTEYWLHGNRKTDRALNPTPHGKENVVDLSINYNAILDNYIKTKGKVLTNSNECSNGTRYEVRDGAGNRAIYVDEKIEGNPPHWHVCY